MANRTFAQLRRILYGSRRAPSKRLRNRRLETQTELLETRTLLSAFNEAGSLLTINLTGSEGVSVTTTGTTYKLALGSGQTWVGTNSARVTGNGTQTLTVTAAGLTAFTDVAIGDSGTANAVAFNDSGANAYSDNFSVLLDGASAGAIRLYGTTTFGASNLSLSTTSSLVVNGPIASAGTLTATGSTITLIGGTVSTSGDQVYNGPVALGASTTNTGANVSFNGTVNAVANTQLLTNGNFEAGSLFGWAMTGTNGGFYPNVPGTLTPISAGTTQSNAAGETTYAVSDDAGFSVESLIQTFTVPIGATQVILSYQMFVNDYDGGPIVNPAGLTTGSGPNQHARVDLLTSSAGTLSTAPADVVRNFYKGTDSSFGTGNPHVFKSYSFNITAFVTPGQTYKLRFASVENQNYLNVGVDNVSIVASTTSPPRSLAVNSAGVTSFGGIIGGTTPLTSVTTDAGGTTQINGGAITTSGAQSYHDDVKLGADTGLTTTNSSIIFDGTLNSSGSARNLSLSAGIGDIVVTGIVGGTFPLNTVTINSANNVTFSSAFNANSLVQTAGTGTTTVDGGSVGGNVGVITNAFSTASGTLTVTGTVTATLQNAFSQVGTSSISAGGIISIFANQDGSGSEGVLQASGSSLATSSTAANALSVTVNTVAVGSTGDAVLALLQTGAGGTVTVNTRRGAITDNNAAAVNIQAGGVAFIGGNAIGGIGGSDPLETLVNLIAVSMLAGAPGILQLVNTGPFAVATVGTTVGVSGNLASVSLAATGVLTVGSGAGEDISAGSALVTMNSAGVSESSGSTITASGLELRGIGTFTLSEANDIATLAAGTTGAISYRDANGFDIGTVNSVGVSTGGNNLTLESTAAVTQSQALAASGLELLGAGPFTLTNAANNIATLAATATGVISYRDADGFDIGTVNTIGLSSSGNNVTLQSGAAVTQSQTILASGLELLGAGPFTLTSASNNISTLAGSTTGSISYRDLNGFSIGTVNTLGVTTGASNLTLQSGAAVNQSQPIVSAGLQLLGSGPYTLTNSANNVTTLAANTTDTIEFRDTDGFDVGTVSSVGITTSDDSVNLQSGAALTISQPITLGNANLHLTSVGAVSQLASVSAQGLILSGAGTFTLNNSGNAVTNFAVNSTGETAYTDTDAVFVTSVTDLNAITINGISIGTSVLSLTTTGVTQDQPVLAGAVRFLGSGAVVLNGNSNNITTLAGDLNSGSISFHDADSLAVGSVVTTLTGSTSGITTGFPLSGGNVTLRAGQSDPTGQLFVNSSIDTSAGSNGNLLIGGGVVVGASLILGAGTIDLGGGANFPDIVISNDTSITLTGGTATLQPNQDIIVRAQLQTINGGLTLNADADNNGVGGVWVDESASGDAQILAAGALLLQGSDVAATGATVDSVRVDDDTVATSDQIVATGTLTVQSKSGFAPASANVYLDGISRTSGAGAVTVTAQNSVILTSQLTSASGSLNITATTGDVTVLDSGLAGAEILANGVATITINASGTTNLGSLATIQSAGGAITFNTNDLSVNTTDAAIDATVAGTVTIRNLTANRTIDLGTDAVGALGITDGELDRVTHASVIVVGRRADGFDTGNINVTAGPISAASVNTLHLIAGNSILESANGFITQANLAAEATNDIQLNTASNTPLTPNQNDNDVDNLALKTFSVGSNATFWDADGFVISTVDTLNGINVNNTTQLSSGVESTLPASDVTQTQRVATVGLQLLGQGNFTLDSASNDVTTLAGNVTNSITYTDANSVTVGTLTLNAVTSVGTTSGSLFVTAQSVIVNNAITTTSELGFVTLDVTSLLNINGLVGGGASVDPIINSKGYVQQTGTGNVELEGKIVTTDDDVSFHSAVKIGTTPGSNAVIDTGSTAGGNITFSNTVQGSTAAATPTFENLTLNAGTGDILFTSQVGGGGFSLGQLTVSSARNVTTNVGVTAREVKQTAGSGETKFNGFVQTNQANGIDLTSNYITFNGSIQTTNGGTVKINNAGDFQIVAGTGSINADGAVTQTGVGLSLTGGSIVTTDDAISFAGDAYISNTPITMNAGNGNVTFAKLLQVNNKTLTLRDGNAVDLGTRTTIASGILNVFVGASAVVGSLNETSGELFTGTGTVNATLNVGTGATLAPASATSLQGTGILTFNGNVNLASGAVYSAELNAATVGTGYDQVVINGSNVMNITAGAVLQASRNSSFSPAAGTPLKIVDGNTTTIGNFSGATDGTTLFLNGAYFTIGYNSPTGDIVLTSATAPGGTCVIIDDQGGSVNTSAAPVFVGAWTANTVAGRGFTNDLEFASPTTRAAPTATATYTFTGLTPGTYRVSTTWFPLSNRATNSPFTISGGSSPLTVLVNQVNAPSSFTSNGATWQDLAPTYTITGSTLTVVLGNQLANGYVIADAVRIEAQSSAGPKATVINTTDGNLNLTNNSGTVDFGTITQGTADLQKTITIQNTGSTPLILGSATLTAPAGFQISGYTPGSLAPNASMPLTIKLLNATSGNFSGVVSIQTNDSGANPFSFNLMGSVVSSKVWVSDNLTSSSSSITTANALVVGSGVTATYADSGTWQNNTDIGVGFMGDLRFSTGGAASTATWQFSGLVSGTYRVSVNYRAESNRTSSADFGVTDGVTSTNKTINEQNVPNDFLSSGVYWKDLFSSFTVSGSVLSVTLNSQTSAAGYVIADAVRIERLSPLQAADGEAANPVAEVLSDEDLQRTSAAAVVRWEAVGLDATQISVLHSIAFQVSNLPSAYLGGETDGSILIDSNAAGYGWYVDANPNDDTEFSSLDGTADLLATESDVQSHMDLLTVLMHELGHRLGFDDSQVSPKAGLMGDSLALGVRRLPEPIINPVAKDDYLESAEGENIDSNVSDQVFYMLHGELDGGDDSLPVVVINYGGLNGTSNQTHSTKHRGTGEQPKHHANLHHTNSHHQGKGRRK